MSKDWFKRNGEKLGYGIFTAIIIGIAVAIIVGVIKNKQEEPPVYTDMGFTTYTLMDFGANNCSPCIRFTICVFNFQ